MYYLGEYIETLSHIRATTELVYYLARTYYNNQKTRCKSTMREKIRVLWVPPYTAMIVSSVLAKVHNR